MECKEHLEVDVHRPWLGLVVCVALPARLFLCPALFLAKSPQFWMISMISTSVGRRRRQIWTSKEKSSITCELFLPHGYSAV